MCQAYETSSIGYSPKGYRKAHFRQPGIPVLLRDFELQMKGSPEPPELSKLQDAHKQANFSIETLKGGVRVADLPQTFQDAMRIVHECGLKYIWIDSLCIIQDVKTEGVNLDWDIEAMKMCDIYKGGVL